MAIKKKIVKVTRYIYGLPGHEMVFVTYRKKMARFHWNNGRNSTWEKVGNYTENKLMLLLNDEVSTDKLDFRHAAARPSLARTLGLSLRGIQ